MIEEIKPYVETVDKSDKEKIYFLYFERLYSYDEIIKVFHNKYTHSQLRSIILERYKKYGQRN